MNVDAVLYHANCNDGITGAFFFWYIEQKLKNSSNPEVLWKDIKYIPTTFDQTKDWSIDTDPFTVLKDLRDVKKIIMVDISFKRIVIKKLSEVLESIIILDHHKSAENELKNINEECHNVQCIFDMSKCGAEIAWDYLAPTYPFFLKEKPWFLQTVSDRDLWKWSNPDSKALSAALNALRYFSFEKLDTLMIISNRFGDDVSHFIKTILKDIGVLIINVQKEEIDNACKRAVLKSFRYKDKIYEVKVVENDSGRLRSEIGNELSKDCDFAAICRVTEDNSIWVSLRTSKESVNLSEICASLGGGGHIKAAGFTIPSGHKLEQYFF